MGAVFVAERREFDAHERLEIDHAKVSEIGRFIDQWIRCRFAGPDHFAGKDEMDGLAGLGIRPVEKEIDPGHFAVDETGFFKCGFYTFKVVALHQHVYILSVADGGFVNRGHPRRDGIAAYNGVGDFVPLECGAGTN